MLEKPQTFEEAPPQEPLVKALVARPSTPLFYADNYTAIRASIQAGMGLETFDAQLADRIEAAIRQSPPLLECWPLFLPDDEAPQLAGSVTFFIAYDPIFDVNYMYIYSLHCSMKVELESWRGAFGDLFAYCEKRGCKKIWARTGLERVVEIAKDNGFVVSHHLERSI